MSFATRQYLKDMTGAKRPKELIEWLEEHAPGRWKPGIDGWPRVHIKVAEEIFGVEKPTRAKKRDVNLDHLKGRNGKATHQEPTPP